MDTVWYEAMRADLKPELVLAIIEVGSGFKLQAVSAEGDRGLMQISRNWAERLGVADPSQLFHLQANIRIGCVLLRHFLDQHDGNVRNALFFYGRKVGFGYADAVIAANTRWQQLSMP